MKKMSKHYDAVISMIREAGETLSKHFGRASVVSNKSHSATDVVTKLDTQTETFLAERLRDLDPSIAFVGEECGGDKNAERFWLVDPIDGTGHFVRGIPFCTTLLALIEEGRVVFSVTYDFVRKDVYSAEKGCGAMKNGKRIHVSTRSSKKAYMFYDIRFVKKRTVKAFLALEEYFVLMNTISTGFEFALVASGAIDGRICIDPYEKDYDYAPGSLLVAEAGGVVRNIGREDFSYRNDSFVATNTRIDKDLRRKRLVP